MANQRVCAILIRLSSEEKAAFKRAAVREGLPVATWCRSKMVLAARETDRPEVPRENGVAASA